MKASMQDIDPLNPLFVLVALIVLHGTLTLAGRGGGAEPPVAGRYAALDGLRGYLAFFVFMHHSAYWYIYLRTGRWDELPSGIFTYLGQGSVMLFFMLSSFLFFGKLLDARARARALDWQQLFSSRLLRLVPLYAFSLALILLIVAWSTEFTLRQPATQVLAAIVKWAAFTIFGTPDINGVHPTYLINAGVAWSLIYEWIFYFSLPALAVMVGVMPPVRVLLCSSALMLIAVSQGHFDPYLTGALAGGVVAAALVRIEIFRRFSTGGASTALIIASLLVVILLVPAPRSVPALVPLTIAFAMISCGNSLFGALTNRLARTLGEIAYSIYLLHGIILFVTFNFVIGTARSATLSPLEHWTTVCVCTALLVPVCLTTFRYIEAPALRAGVGRPPTALRKLAAASAK
jgi:peptidoglycan/LPS O-acetylase OafA/YrhL